jgi:hypothetical protein
MSRRISRSILGSIATFFAVLYFLIDALFWLLIKPVTDALGKVPIFARIAAWAASLGPYPTLLMFVIPLAVFEPVKPVGAYLIATGHVTEGVLLIIIAEVFKIMIVERLWHMSRDKLLSIPAFAWVYTRLMAWLRWLQEFPAWQAVEHIVERMKSRVRKWRRKAGVRG